MCSQRQTDWAADPDTRPTPRGHFGLFWVQVNKHPTGGTNTVFRTSKPNTAETSSHLLVKAEPGRGGARVSPGVRRSVQANTTAAAATLTPGSRAGDRPASHPDTGGGGTKPVREALQEGTPE